MSYPDYDDLRELADDDEGSVDLLFTMLERAVERARAERKEESDVD